MQRSVRGLLRFGSQRRAITTFLDHAALAKQLEAKGITLKFGAPTPDDIADENNVESPSKKIDDLVDRILNLNRIEYGQYSCTVEVSFILVSFVVFIDHVQCRDDWEDLGSHQIWQYIEQKIRSILETFKPVSGP